MLIVLLHRAVGGPIKFWPNTLRRTYDVVFVLPFSPVEEQLLVVTVRVPLPGKSFQTTVTEFLFVPLDSPCIVPPEIVHVYQQLGSPPPLLLETL